MKNNYGKFILLTALALLIGCAGAGAKTALQPPPSDQYTLYARGLSTDQIVEENADSNAELRARSGLATAVEAQLKSLTKQAAEQVGIGNDSELNTLYSQAIKQTVNQRLVGSVIHQRALTVWDKRTNAFRAEVIMKIDIGPAKEELINNIKQRQLLYERMRTGDLFKELEAEANK